MRWVADFLYLIAGLLYLPVAFYNALVVGKNRRGWRERFGWLPRFDPATPRIWFHAVSLGEVNCTPQLIRAMQERLPDHEFVVSTTTDTGFARAVQLYGRAHVFRCPLDFSLVMAGALRRVCPKVLVLVELEVWYNMVRMATRQRIPVAVVNGRLTERSARRFGILARAVRPMFADLAWVGAQDETMADRFVRLGAAPDRVNVISSLKWDTAQVADHIEGETALASAMGIDRSRPLWVCGSTGNDEEVILLDAYERLLRDDATVARGMQGDSCNADTGCVPQLAIIPRKPERFGDVARLIERTGFACVRRSDHPDDGSPAVPGERSVLLGDSMGELRKFYSLADVTFVGRSLVPMGGSDPMEVAALARPIVVGPYTDNFRLPVEALAAGDAVRIVPDAKSLSTTVGALLRSRDDCEALGRRAREVVLRHQGATSRTIEGIMGLLHVSPSVPEHPMEERSVTVAESAK